jgi:hypothetical protein
MHYLMDRHYSREDLLNYPGLVGGEFSPMGNGYTVSILYSDEQETNFDEINEWAKNWRPHLHTVLQNKEAAGVGVPAQYTDVDPLDLQGKQPLFEAMNTSWWELPHEQQKQVIVNAFRATMLSPRMNLKSNAILYQNIMHIPADEADPNVFENHVRELKKRWDAQGQMGLEGQPEDVMALDELLPGKFLPGFWGNLRRLANLGPYAEELTALALRDMEAGGTGEIFRDGVLKLAIPGVGPKVASFAWLALAPLTSELATIDVHMMRYMGEGDDSPKSDADYFALEQRLKEERDQYYPDRPLTQYQWGVWDKQRTPGFHQDHTPLRAYEPVDYREIKWEPPVRPPRPRMAPVAPAGQMTLGASDAEHLDLSERYYDGFRSFFYIEDKGLIIDDIADNNHDKLVQNHNVTHSDMDKMFTAGVIWDN